MSDVHDIIAGGGGRGEYCYFNFPQQFRPVQGFPKIFKVTNKEEKIKSFYISCTISLYFPQCSDIIKKYDLVKIKQASKHSVEISLGTRELKVQGNRIQQWRFHFIPITKQPITDLF